MLNIKPISDLRNYNEVLSDCENGEPVILTKNGRGKYVIVDIEEYQKQQAMIKLLIKLAEAESTVKSGDEWMTLDEVKKSLGV